MGVRVFRGQTHTVFPVFAMVRGWTRQGARMTALDDDDFFGMGQTTDCQKNGDASYWKGYWKVFFHQCLQCFEYEMHNSHRLGH
ncbi:hypothetical protein D5044_26010 [Verminephrobacter eiseniae]|nr:hypothetical protein [Verminephrobacter eiseniae]